MVGKLTTVLAKKEAEAYCSQGLHQEALRLYQNLLSTSPNLGDGFKNAIQGQVDALKTKLDHRDTKEHQMLAAPEIRRIREGWGANATEADILVCAQAFCQVGHYQDALSEVAKLIQKGGDFQNAIGIVAECLEHLRTPKQLQKTIGAMGKKIISQLEPRCHFHLILTEEMVRRKAYGHALALYSHLQGDPVISQKAPQRLAAIACGLEQLCASEADPEPEEAPSPTDSEEIPAQASADAPDAEEQHPTPSVKHTGGLLGFFKKMSRRKKGD